MGRFALEFPKAAHPTSASVAAGHRSRGPSRRHLDRDLAVWFGFNLRSLEKPARPPPADSSFRKPLVPPSPTRSRGCFPAPDSTCVSLDAAALSCHRTIGFRLWSGHAVGLRFARAIIASAWLPDPVGGKVSGPTCRSHRCAAAISETALTLGCRHQMPTPTVPTTSCPAATSCFCVRVRARLSPRRPASGGVECGDGFSPGIPSCRDDRIKQCGRAARRVVASSFTPP